jgi:hypothetical protein
MVLVYVQLTEQCSIHDRQLTLFAVNNRGTVDWCLFGRFAEESNKNLSESTVAQRCGNACSPIRNATDYTIKSNPSSYDFCESGGNFTTDSASCLSCLYGQEDLTILGNSA